MHPLETYLRALHQDRSSGEAVNETSYYGHLQTLLNEVGKTLRPRVRCVMQLKNRGAGHPDGGLFTPDQRIDPKAKARNLPLFGHNPARGVIEVKGASDDAWVTADSEQVTKYWRKYQQVLVTNYRDFLLIGRRENGKPEKLEYFSLAESEEACFFFFAGNAVYSVTWECHAGERGAQTDP
jgi:hypothetical protein